MHDAQSAGRVPVLRTVSGQGVAHHCPAVRGSDPGGADGGGGTAGGTAVHTGHPEGQSRPQKHVPVRPHFSRPTQPLSSPSPTLLRPTGCTALLRQLLSAPQRRQ